MVTVVFPMGGNNGNGHGGVSRGGETIVAVVFLMGGETGGATRWGQSSVANVCVGDVNKTSAVVEGRGVNPHKKRRTQQRAHVDAGGMLGSERRF